MRFSSSHRGTSTVLMLLFLMTLTSTGLMYYWFQRCRSVERQLAAWESTRQGAPAPPVMEPWGLLSFSTLGTSAAESLVAGASLAEPHLTRPHVIQEKIEAKALAAQQQIEKARDEARNMVAHASQLPVGQRLVGALASQAGLPSKMTEGVQQVQLQLQPAPAPAGGAESNGPEAAPAIPAEGAAVELPPVPVAAVQDGAQALRDPGPGAGLPATPLETSSQVLQQGETDLVSAAAMEAAPTPAPRRPARIRSVYDLEPSAGSGAPASRPRSQAQRGEGQARTSSAAPAPFAPRRNRHATPAAESEGMSRP